MVEHLIRWGPIALMLVPAWRGWRAMGHVMALLDHRTDTPMPWVVRKRSTIMQRSIGQLQVCLGLYMALNGIDQAALLFVVGGLMWALPGLFGGMLWEYERDHKEPIGPEPMPDDHPHPIGPEDKRFAPDGHVLEWETCYSCRLGITAIDEDGAEYWLDGSRWPVGTRPDIECGPGDHFPQSRMAPRDREGLERWLRE